MLRSPPPSPSLEREWTSLLFLPEPSQDSFPENSRTCWSAPSVCHSVLSADLEEISDWLSESHAPPVTPSSSHSFSLSISLSPSPSLSLSPPLSLPTFLLPPELYHSNHNSQHHRSSQPPQNSHKPGYPISQNSNYPISQISNYPNSQNSTYPNSQNSTYPNSQNSNHPTSQNPNFQNPNYSNPNSPTVNSPPKSHFPTNPHSPPLSTYPTSLPQLTNPSSPPQSQLQTNPNSSSPSANPDSKAPSRRRRSTGSGRRYKGVRQRASGRWIAEIKDVKYGVRTWLGTFDSAEEAALAYDRAARAIRGAAARTNFGHSSAFLNPRLGAPSPPRGERGGGSVESGTWEKGRGRGGGERRGQGREGEGRGREGKQVATREIGESVEGKLEEGRWEERGEGMEAVRMDMAGERQILFWEDNLPEEMVGEGREDIGS